VCETDRPAKTIEQLTAKFLFEFPPFSWSAGGNGPIRFACLLSGRP
jgi:hypothetical protein